jgi:hypothetical protein
VVTEHKTTAEQTFQWNDQTKFSERDRVFERSKPATASAIKEGERVHFKYVQGAEPQLLESVHIVAAKGEKPASETP